MFVSPRQSQDNASMETTPTDLRALLTLAKDSVLAAGKLLREGGQTLRIVHEHLGHDVKLEADRAAERLLREKLEKAGLPIIGEEYGGDSQLLRQDQLYWTVDPLDGTVNYSLKIPFSCSCVGLWRGLTPIAGATYDFWHDEIFAGAEGLGATLNGKPLQCPSDIQSKKEAMAAIILWPPTTPLQMFELVPQYRQHRSFGSCALQIAYLAAGRLGAFYEASVNIWDIGSSLAILKAAGGAMNIKPIEGFRVKVSAAWNKNLLPHVK